MARVVRYLHAIGVPISIVGTQQALYHVSQLNRGLVDAYTDPNLLAIKLRSSSFLISAMIAANNLKCLRVITVPL